MEDHKDTSKSPHPPLASSPTNIMPRSGSPAGAAAAGVRHQDSVRSSPCTASTAFCRFVSRPVRAPSFVTAPRAASRACASGCGWVPQRPCGRLDGLRVGEKAERAAGPGKAVTGRKGTLAKVTRDSCSSGGGSAEGVRSRHSLKVEPAGFDDLGTRGRGKGQNQARSREDGAAKFCVGGGVGGGVGVAQFSRWEIGAR